MMPWAKSLVILPLFAVLTACIILPAPRRVARDSRENLAAEVPAFIAVGETMRSEVLLRLGEPDGATADDRQFVYIKRAYAGGQVLYLYGPSSVLHPVDTGRVDFNDADAGALSLVYDQLVIEFDERGKVRFARHERAQCVEKFAGYESDDQCVSMNNLDLKLRFNGVVFPYVHWCTGIRIDSFSMAIDPTIRRNCLGGHLALGDSAMFLYSNNANNKSVPLLILHYDQISGSEEVRWTDAFMGVVVKKSDGTPDTLILTSNHRARDTAKVVDFLEAHGKVLGNRK